MVPFAPQDPLAMLPRFALPPVYVSTADVMSLLCNVLSCCAALARAAQWAASSPMASMLRLKYVIEVQAKNGN